MQNNNSNITYANQTEIVKVIWEDAQTQRGTAALKSARQEKLVPVITVGYLINKTEDCITLSSFIYIDENFELLDERSTAGFTDVHVIPISQIRDIIFLEENKNNYVDLTSSGSGLDDLQTEKEKEELI